MSPDESPTNSRAPDEPATNSRAPDEPPTNGSAPDEPPAPDPAEDEPGYAAAMAELEQILEELEGEDPDVDVLAERVERAATLIEVCRRRIANAGIQVERVVASLEADGGE